MTVNLPKYGESNEVIKPNSKIQISSLLEENPMIKLSNNTGDDQESSTSELFNQLSTMNDQVHQFKWEKLIGTDLIFDEYGELVCKNKDHLDWDPSVRFNSKPRDVDVSVDGVKADGLDDKTTFYKQLLKKLQQRQEQQQQKQKE